MRCLHLRAVVEKFRGGEAITIRRTAHLVQSDHAVVAVEGCVFHAFCHHGRSELLKPIDKFGFEWPARTQQQHISDEVEQTGVEIGPVALGPFHALGDFLTIFFRDLIAVRHDIGSVDREAGSDFADSAPDFCSREVAAIAVVFADFDEQTGEAIHIAAQRFLLDIELLVVGNGWKIGRLLREITVDLRQLFQTIRLHQPDHCKRSGSRSRWFLRSASFREGILRARESFLQ